MRDRPWTWDGCAVPLQVNGIAALRRSGLLTIAAGASSGTVFGVTLSSASLALATLQQDRAGGGVWVRSAVPNIAGGSFTVHLSKAVTASITVAWFVVNWRFGSGTAAEPAGQRPIPVSAGPDAPAARRNDPATAAAIAGFLTAATPCPRRAAQAPALAGGGGSAGQPPAAYSSFTDTDRAATGFTARADRPVRRGRYGTPAHRDLHTYNGGTARVPSPLADCALLL